MKNFICCSLTALFLVLDMLAGNISLFPAFSVYTALIFFLAYGWKYGIVSALCSGMILDALYGHSFSYLSLIFLVAVILGAIAAERGQTLAQMALAWLYSRPGVTSVLIGASKPEQIAENLKMTEAAPFTEEELAAIDAAI